MVGARLSSTGLATYDAMAYSQSVSQAYLVFRKVHFYHLSTFQKLFKHTFEHSCVNA